MPYKTCIKKKFPDSRADIYAVLRDLGNVKLVLPDLVESCECEGDGVGAVRTMRYKKPGRYAKERIHVLVEDRMFAYALYEHNAPDIIPVKNHFAMLYLADADAGGTEVIFGCNWDATDPAREIELLPIIQGLLSIILDNVVALAPRYAANVPKRILSKEVLVST